ncbi:MAG: Hpt domain-containing protein [Anaerolineae bacterium]|nr:Hpt domain-containing protein [Anaerolineae bacterium]
MSEEIINDPNALDQYLDLLGEDGGEFVIEIIDTFLENAPENIDLMDISIAENDPVTLRRAAHTLKTGCSTMGATLLSENFLKLEEAGAAGNLKTIGNLLELCKNDYRLLKTELEKKKNSLQ